MLSFLLSTSFSKGGYIMLDSFLCDFSRKSSSKKCEVVSSRVKIFWRWQKNSRVSLSIYFLLHCWRACVISHIAFFPLKLLLFILSETYWVVNIAPISFSNWMTRTSGWKFSYWPFFHNCFVSVSIKLSVLCYRRCSLISFSVFGCSKVVVWWKSFKKVKNKDGGDKWLHSQWTLWKLYSSCRKRFVQISSFAPGHDQKTSKMLHEKFKKVCC